MLDISAIGKVRLDAEEQAASRAPAAPEVSAETADAQTPEAVAAVIPPEEALVDRGGAASDPKFDPYRVSIESGTTRLITEVVDRITGEVKMRIPLYDKADAASGSALPTADHYV